MDDSIKSLQNLCIHRLALNLDSVTYIRLCQHGVVLRFRCSKVFLPECIGNRLFAELNKLGHLTSLVISLFHPEIIRLSSVKISCGSCIGFESLQLLKSHHLRSVEISGLDGVSLGTLSSFFQDEAFDNLKELSLYNARLIPLSKLHFSFSRASWEKCRWKFKRRHLPFWTPLCARDKFVKERLAAEDSKSQLKIDSSCYCRQIALQDYDKYESDDFKLPASVESFNISGTNIEYTKLSISASDVKKLIKIDLSCCQELQCINFLEKFSDSLKYLSVYDTHIAHNSNIVRTLVKLKQLRYLDINTSSLVRDSYINELLMNPHFCPLLESIDISGHADVQLKSLLKFTACHPHIKFIGMHSIPLAIRRNLELPQCKFTSLGSYDDLLESLKRYSIRRDVLLSVLDHLRLLVYAPNRRNQLMPFQPIVEGIFTGLLNFRKDMRIQIAGISIVSKILQQDLPHKLVKILAILSTEILQQLDQVDGPPVFTIEFQMLCFNMLMQNEVFSEVSYDRAAVVGATFAALRFRDPELTKCALQLCSFLFNGISRAEAAHFICEDHFKNLRVTIHSKFMDNQRLSVSGEKVVKFGLSILWSLTDESQAGCHLMLRIFGLHYLISCMEKFSECCKAREKILGILSNISEVSSLKKSLISSEMLLTMLMECLTSDELLVSVLAAFIISQIILDFHFGKRSEPPKEAEFLKQLLQAVQSWETPEEEIIKYRSFDAFIPLVKAFTRPQIQLFALWMLKNVTIANRERYCPMLLSHNLFTSVVKIYRKAANVELHMYAIDTLNLLVDFFKLDNIEDVIRIHATTKGFSAYFPANIPRYRYTDSWKI